MKTRILLSHRARRVFVFAHLWLGLVLGAWFSVIGVSGSILAWRSELGAAELSRQFPVEKPGGEAKIIPISAAISAIRRQYPDLKPEDLSSITIPNAGSAHYAFTLGRERRTQRTLLVDPYSARIHGPIAPRSGLVATVNQLHQRLIAGFRGYLVNGLLTIFALPLLLSGLWLWWPKNVPQLVARLKIKRGANWHRTLYDWHNVMGIYLYVVLFGTTLTGVLMVSNHIARDGGLVHAAQEFVQGETPPSREGRGGRRGERDRNRAANRAVPSASPQNRAPQVGVGKQRISNDALLVLARQAVPGYQITRLQLPERPDEAVQFSYAVPTGFVTSQNLFIDPYAGKVLPTRAPGSDWNQIVRGLHFGEFGGLVTKLIYTFAGLMPLGLFSTGTWMWWNKKRKRHR